MNARRLLPLLPVALLVSSPVDATTPGAAVHSDAARDAAGHAAGSQAADRVRADRAQLRPLVAHVVVALCDNAHQGIVPVPRLLGNGQDPQRNLYWGARFGVKTYLSRASGWRRVPCAAATRPGVLERVAFRSAAGPAPLFLVADAWDGARMSDAIRAFLEMSSGRDGEPLVVDGLSVDAGGTAHLQAFVGHNGLMDFDAPLLAPGAEAPGRAVIVLACASRPYFAALLRRARVEPLLLTTGLMAPEAYSLEAAVRTWFTSLDVQGVREAAAQAYARHQGCGLPGARRLFEARR